MGAKTPLLRATHEELVGTCGSASHMVMNAIRAMVMEIGPKSTEFLDLGVELKVEEGGKELRLLEEMIVKIGMPLT